MRREWLWTADIHKNKARLLTWHIRTHSPHFVKRRLHEQFFVLQLLSVIHTLIESSRCCGLSLVSSCISCMGWVGEWDRDQTWTDSGSQRRLHSCRSKPPWDMTCAVYKYIHSFIKANTSSSQQLICLSQKYSSTRANENCHKNCASRRGLIWN